MRTDRNHAVRVGVNRALKRVSKLENMTYSYLRTGKVAGKGPEITRTQFREAYAREAELLKQELRALVSAVILEQ